MDFWKKVPLNIIIHHPRTMSQTTIENPNSGPRIRVLHTMVFLMSKIFKEVTKTTTIVIEIKTTPMMTIKAINNLVIKHNSFHATITIVTMIETGSSLTFVNLWRPSFKD